MKIGSLICFGSFSIQELYGYSFQECIVICGLWDRVCELFLINNSFTSN